MGTAVNCRGGTPPEARHLLVGEAGVHQPVVLAAQLVGLVALPACPSKTACQQAEACDVPARCMQLYSSRNLACIETYAVVQPESWLVSNIPAIRWRRSSSPKYVAQTKCVHGKPGGRLHGAHAAAVRWASRC